MVALSSYHDKLSKDRCKEIGMKEFINKPIRNDVLLKLVLKYNF